MAYYDPKQIQGSLNTLGAAALAKSGGEFSISTDAFSLKMATLNPEASANLALGTTTLALPPLSSLGTGLAASMIQWTSNPYADDSQIKPDTLPLSLNVLDPKGGKVSVHNLTTPISFSWDLNTSDPRFQTPPKYMARCDLNEMYSEIVSGTYQRSYAANATGRGAWSVPCLLDVWKPLICTEFEPNSIATMECPKPILTPNCLYWNTNKSTWSSDGCTPTMLKSSIHCSCTHLTDFSSRIDAVGQANVAVFANAANVYSLSGLLKYAQWFGIFGGIAALTLLLGALVMRIDILTTTKYVKALCQDPIIHSVFDNAPNTAIYIFDSKSTKICTKKKKKEKPLGNPNRPMSFCTRILQQHSRLQFLFRYDPRLARLFRLLALFAVQYHSLFITAFLYGFTYGSPNSTSAQNGMAWYEIILLSIITSALNIPVISFIIGSLNAIGLNEFKYKFPLLFEEYTRRLRFEKYALVYLSKKETENTEIYSDVNNTETHDETKIAAGDVDDESWLDLFLMYVCCKSSKPESEDTSLETMTRQALLIKMIKIIKAKYDPIEGQESYWSYLPCHTSQALFFLVCSAGWLAWCLNYLLLFASSHPQSVGENVMISYATSELTTVVISQPINILITYIMFKIMHKYGNYLPSCLRRFAVFSHKNNVHPLYYFSNPWAKESQSAFTSKFAFSLFVRCPAIASNTNIGAYAPAKALLDDVESDIAVCDVEKLYNDVMRVKAELTIRDI